MLGMVISNVISILNAYIFHKFITFKSYVKGIGLAGEFFRFSATYLLTFCFSLGMLPLFVLVMGIDPKIAGAMVILFCTGISYVPYSRFSFSHKHRSY